MAATTLIYTGRTAIEENHRQKYRSGVVCNINICQNIMVDVFCSYIITFESGNEIL